MPHTARETKPEPTIADKVRFLSTPGAYPHGPETVDVIETHMSWVFLAGELVYKLKKPACNSFLDLRALEQRAENVEVELRLNRRMSPEVYLGARALRQAPDGGLALDDAGRIVDWLVEMRRLPEERTIKSLIAAGRARPAELERVAGTLVSFYEGLAAEPVSADVVIAQYEEEHAKNAAVLRDPQFGLDAAETDAALEGFEAVFGDAREALRQRVDQGHFVEGNGDLRLEHIFMTDPVAVIDCLEFSKPLRTIDPFEEIVCLGLDAALLGADWVFPVLYEGLADGLADRPPPVLLSFYWRYRALLRARFAIQHLAEPVVRTPAKWRPLALRCIALSGEAESRIRRRPPGD